MEVVMPTNKRSWEGGHEASTTHELVPSFLPLAMALPYSR